MVALFRRFALFGGLWLVLTSGDPEAWLVGASAVVAAAAVSMRLLPPREQRLKLLLVLQLAPGFFWRSLKGGADVAWRALHPHRPLRVAWLIYPSRLPPGSSLVLLGSQISLVPGILVAGSDDDRLYLHCLDCAQPIEAQVAEEEERIGACTGVPIGEAIRG